MRLRAALLCLLVLTAGCATNPQGGDASGGTPTFTEPDVHPGMTPRVGLLVYALEPVRVTVIELNPNGRGVVSNETYTDRVDVEFDGDNVLRTHGNYRVVVRVDGTVRWDETVRYYEGYELRVESNGTVVVTQHSMA